MESEMVDRYMLKDIAKAFIDMEFPEFLMKKNVEDPVMNNKGHFECRMKRYLTGGGYLKMIFTYVNTSFEYELKESLYKDDDGKDVHYISVFIPLGMQRIHIDEDDCVRRIVSFVLNDVKKQFDAYDISDRKR